MNEGGIQAFSVSDAGATLLNLCILLVHKGEEVEQR